MARTVILHSQRARDTAKQYIDSAPPMAVVKIAEAKRTPTQNDKMWAMLTDLSVQKAADRRYTPEMWKAVMMHGCGHEQQFLQGVDGLPFPAGFKSSQLTKAQMIALIDYIEWFGSEQGIVWSEPQPV